MKLSLERTWFLPTRTIGRLFVDYAFECFTCEDRIRHGPKVYGETCIPAGTYDIKATPSPKFKRVMPEITGVPGFKGIRIHGGGKLGNEADTLGCVIVGDSHGPDGVEDSPPAARRVEKLLMAALKRGESVRIQITDPAEAKAA